MNSASRGAAGEDQNSDAGISISREEEAMTQAEVAEMEERFKGVSDLHWAWVYFSEDSQQWI